MYWCTCDRSRGELIDSLSTHIDISIDEFEKKAPHCLHIKAAKCILQEIDAVHDISPEQELCGNVKQHKKLNYCYLWCQICTVCSAALLPVYYILGWNLLIVLELWNHIINY